MACGVLLLPMSVEAQEWAETCFLVVDGPGNEGNDDPAEAQGASDCFPTCPMDDCRTQLGNFGVLECQNLSVPGGWIVSVPGADNDFTVFEMWVDDSYDVYAEDPDVPGDWIFVATVAIGSSKSFDLPPGLIYTDRIRIEDRGETQPSPKHTGADIDAIASGTPAVEECLGWGPSNAVSSSLGSGNGAGRTSHSGNCLFSLFVPVGAILLLRVLRRRK